MPYQTGIRLPCGSQNPANGFPARLLGPVPRAGVFCQNVHQAPPGSPPRPPRAPAIPLPGQPGRRRARLRAGRDQKTYSKDGYCRIVGQEVEAREPPQMTTPRVARVTSMAPWKSIQRHVTDLFVRSRWCTRPLSHPQQHGYGQELDVPGIPEARPVGQQEDTGQPDEPAAPDGNPCRIQDHVRVGQDARRNPVP